MTAIVFPHVCCNDGIITDLSGYGCTPGNLGLGEAAKSNVVQGTGSSQTDVMSQKSVTDLVATKQPKGNYASSDIYQVIPGYTFMHSPEKKYRAVIGDDGVFRVIDNTNPLNPTTFSFDKSGSMISGAVPAGRVTGLFSQWLAVTGARAVNTTYTNPRDVPMYIVITLMHNPGEGNIFVKDSSRETQVHYFGSKTAEVSLSVSFMVPPRGEYRMTGTMSIRTWSECF